MLLPMSRQQRGVVLAVAGAAMLAAYAAAPAARAQNARAADPCDQYLKTPLPAEAAAVPAPKAWPDCASYKSYSGIGRKVDYAAARRCAWAERLAQQANLEPKYTVAALYGGSAMLAVLYANGEGVEQNKPLALRFACEAGPEPKILEDILALPDQAHITEKKLRYCDEVQNTMEIGFCAGWDAEIQDQERRNSLASLSAHWRAAQQEAFRALSHAEEAYSTAHARGEIDLAGSGRAIWQLDAEQELRDRFLAAIQAYEQGQLPHGSADDAAKADRSLNRIYGKAIATAEAGKEGYGAIQPEGVRKAERAWLTYRDAWIAFAKLRYPAAGRDAWLTLLTNDRIAILEDTLCEMGSTEASCDQREEDAQQARPLP